MHGDEPKRMPRPGPGPSDDAPAQPEDVAADLTAIGRKLVRHELVAGELADDLAEAIDRFNQLNVSGALKAKPPRRRKEPPRPTAETRVLQLLARKGVEQVVIDRDAQDAASVTIDGYPEMSLQPAEADLLECLCAETERDSGDALIGFKTRKELARRLGKYTGQKVSERAVTTRLWRLRQVCETTGNNRFLVETNRRNAAYRLALRRGGRVVITRAHG